MMQKPKRIKLIQSCPILVLLLSLLLLSACSTQNTSAQAPTSASSNQARSMATSEVIRAQEQHLLSQDYAVFRKAQLSNPAYTLSLNLSADSDVFSGTVVIEVELVEGNSSPVTIDYDSGSINNISVNGENVSWDYTRWYISLAAEVFKPGANTIIIDYQRPYSSDGDGLHKFTDPANGEVYLYTNFEPYNANRLFPHFDQPNLKAPLTLDVLAPAQWQVIANTRETNISEVGSQRHWRFATTAPISSYIYAMHAGPFISWQDQAGNIPLRLFVRSSLAEYVNTEDWFTPTKQSFAFFQDYFDVAYPFGKYDQVIVPDFNAGAMENVAAVTFSERYISRGETSIAQRLRIASVISHEMAHMWFGDLVTMDWWNGLWLNESFASYMENLALDRASDFENIWDSFYLGEKLWAYDTDELITTHPVELNVPTTADAFTNFDGITYGKGASVLKQLPYLIGEENFRQGVSNYLKKYSYQNTTLNDFVTELALAANINLDQWQQEWLYQSGVNTLTADFTCDATGITSLRLIQSVPEVMTADKILRSQRTQLGLYQYTENEMALNQVIPVLYSGAVTNVTEAIGEPCPDLVLPNEDDWAYTKINFKPSSVAILNEHINDFSKASTRIMLWQSLWDSTQYLEMPLTQFVDFALSNIAQEENDNVLRLVMDSLGQSFSLFSRLGGYEAKQAEIESFLFQQLLSAEADSELQNIWYASFIGQAHTETALDYLEGLLDDSENIAGIEIDQDKRWSIIVRLNRYQHGDYMSLLETEKIADNSDQGINMSLAAEAIRPELARKQDWLNIIINQPDSMKLASLRTVMSSLFPAEQNALLADSVETILNAVPAVAARDDQGYLDEYVSRLSTRLCTPASVERLQQASADFADSPPLST